MAKKRKAAKKSPSVLENPSINPDIAWNALTTKPIGPKNFPKVPRNPPNFEK